MHLVAGTYWGNRIKSKISCQWDNLLHKCRRKSSFIIESALYSDCVAHHRQDSKEAAKQGNLTLLYSQADKIHYLHAVCIQRKNKTSQASVDKQEVTTCSWAQKLTSRRLGENKVLCPGCSHFRNGSTVPQKDNPGVWTWQKTYSAF